MFIEGNKILPAPRQQVWESLNDADFLRQCIPGCRSVIDTGDGHLDIQLTFAVGPIKANFTADAQKKDVIELTSYVLEGKGSAGPAGSGKGTIHVQLHDIEGGTQLDYSVETEVSGRMAQLGSRMIDGAARRFSEEFFANAARLLGGETTPDASVASTERTPQSEAVLPAQTPVPMTSDAGLVWKLVLGSGLGAFLGTLIGNWIG